MANSFHERLKDRRYEQKKKAIAIVGVVLLLVIVAAGIIRTDIFQKKYIYPYPHKEIVDQYAASYGVENALVAGVIMSESKFQKEVHSPRGAIGLMQLMPDTAKWIAEQIDDSYDMEKLHEPDTNIRFGTWYLASLEKEFKGNEVLVLAAYNAGRGTVHSWMQEYGWDDSFGDVDRIPYAETREYVIRVLKNRENYQKLYDGK